MKSKDPYSLNRPYPVVHSSPEQNGSTTVEERSFRAA